MINLPKQPHETMLELGCGDRRHPQADVAVDKRYIQGVTDFAVDLELPFTAEHNQAIGSDGFDWVYSCWAFEHCSWRHTDQLLKETFRVLKPGGTLVLVLPNTEAQLKYILGKPEPDGDEGSMLFGDLNYSDNTHKSFWCPRTAIKRLSEAGFEGVITTPFGALGTDMIVQAKKPGGVVRLVQPSSAAQMAPPPALISEEAPKNESKPEVVQFQTNVLGSNVSVMERKQPEAPAPIPLVPVPPPVPRESLFTRKYFDGTKGGGYASRGFYWDFPQNWMLFKQIMNRSPESVLELGCGRGYVLKRLQDVGLEAHGFDISQHCYLTRACNGIVAADIITLKHPLPAKQYDMGFSYCFWEHIPEKCLEDAIAVLFRGSKRGLHGITLEGEDDGTDPTRCTIRSKEWWQKRLPKGHEVFSKSELVAGSLPPEATYDNGLVKVNVGSYMTQYHQGWINTDIHDLNGFSQQNGYRFIQNDVTRGLPWKTGEVDCLVSCHMLEHLTYAQGLSFLKDCRRVLKPNTGVMRILVPDAELLCTRYHNYICSRTGNHSDYGTETLDMFDEVSGGCAEAPTSAMKLAALLWEGHQSLYDEETLCRALKEAHFRPMRTEFRKSNCGDLGELIVKQTIDMHPALSLIAEAIPVD